MTILLSNAALAARLQALEDEIGSAGKLELWSGAVPAIDEAPAGTKIAEIDLPADPFSISGNTASKSGSWVAPSADASGEVAFFRITDGTDAVLQGSAGDGGTEDLVLDNASVNQGQQITITSFTLTEGD